MLAYVFSHRPGPEVDVAVYEGALRGFHAALAAATIAGFITSRSYRIGPGYADWYLLESSDALDRLNGAAVSGDRAQTHDLAARMSTDGAGKLYVLAAGDLDLDAACELRLGKPPGMAYADFYETLRPWTSRPDFGLWRRMMVLGPPPEFCLACREEVELPSPMRPEVVRRAPV